VRNKANFSRGRPEQSLGASRAKQSQFHGTGRDGPGPARRGGRSRWSQACETKPISPGRAGKSLRRHGGGRVSAGVKRAKQSQFACKDPNRRGPAGSEALPPLSWIVQNKANLRRARVTASTLWEKGYGDWTLTRASAKQSQFPGPARRTESGICHRTPTTPPVSGCRAMACQMTQRTVQSSVMFVVTP
jgi:hypothetical protein